MSKILGYHTGVDLKPKSGISDVDASQTRLITMEVR